MSGYGGENGKVAYMEEADEDDFPTGPRTYAGSVAPSPTKEKPNTGKSRRDKARRGDSSPTQHFYTDSDSTILPTALIPRRDSKARPRDKDRAANKKVTLVRPPAKHPKASPVVQPSAPRRSMRDEQASYYAADPTMVTPALSRPRAHTTRPSSYYGPSSRPPLANARYYTQPPPAAPPPPQMLPTSFPPPSWAGAGGVSYPLGPPPPRQLPAQGPPDYFNRQHHLQLANRFSRPSSATGHRAPPPPATVHYPHDYEDDDEESESESEEEIAPVQRRTSLRAITNAQQEDRMRMPPPQRPMSARPLSLRSPFAPPPPQKFDDDAFEGESSLYHDVSPFQGQGPLVHRTRRPSMSGRGTPGPYEVAPYSTEVATTNSRRSSGYFGNPPPPSSTKLEERLRRASTYQENISGGPGMRLTAESLKKATRQALASSHSTGSSESFEESDWRQSATTRTTRSSNNNDEDVTIRVKGSAVLKVGGAEMKCADGAEINISSSRLPPGIRSSSDKSSYAEFEERRARMDRPATRTRASSQAGSHSRMLPRLDAPPQMYHFDYPPPARYPPPPSAAPYYNYPNYI